MTSVTSGAVRETLGNAMEMMAILDERGRQVSRRAAQAILTEVDNGLSQEAAGRLMSALRDCCKYQQQAEECARLVCADLDEMARLVHSQETNGLVAA